MGSVYKSPPINRGFTLIELMVTVAIVAILLAVALPSFQNQLRKGHRSAAQSEMMDIANRQEQFLLANRAYLDEAGLRSNGYVFPEKISVNYTWRVSIVTVPVPEFEIILTPYGHQDSAIEGVLRLNSRGIGTHDGDAWDE